MSLVTVPFGLTKGIDRSATMLRSDLASFKTMHNFRQSDTELGKVEQTPYFYASHTYGQGTYWNGAASATEPSTSAVRMYTSNGAFSTPITYATDYVFIQPSATTQQLQVFYQSAVPAAVTINTHCLIVINNVTSLGLTLGLTLDVVIDGGTTFKWRKNGGAYTTLVPITTAGVNIDSNNVTVYFLTATGFTVNDTWSWQRTDYSNDNTAFTESKPMRYLHYKNRTFVLNMSNRLMTIRQDSRTSPVTYVISTGYRPIFGTNIQVFYDHLFVFGYMSSQGGNNYRNAYRMVANSDVSDIENFWATDVNEADLTQLWTARTSSYTGYIFGSSVFGPWLVVYTTDGIFRTSYLGLPTVFSFEYLCDFKTQIGQPEYQTGCVVRATNVDYILAGSEIWTFDGASLTNLGYTLAADFSGVDSYVMGSPVLLTGTYNQKRKTLVVYDQNNQRLVCYQELYKAFYTRGLISAITCLEFSVLSYPDILLAGVANLTVWEEDALWAQTPLQGGTTVPILETQFYSGGRLSVKKELSGLYIGAYLIATDPTKYAIGGANRINVSWYTSDTGRIGTLSTDGNSYWYNLNPDGWLSLPHIDFRAIALRFTVTTASSAPAGGVQIFAIEPLVYNTELRRIEK